MTQTTSHICLGRVFVRHRLLCLSIMTPGVDYNECICFCFGNVWKEASLHIECYCPRQH